MTYKELYEKALWDLEHDKITLGEFEDMIEPLNKEILKEGQTDGVITELEKIKAEIEKIIVFEESCNESATLAYECLDVVKKELYELKGEQE